MKLVLFTIQVNRIHSQFSSAGSVPQLSQPKPAGVDLLRMTAPAVGNLRKNQQIVPLLKCAYALTKSNNAPLIAVYRNIIGALQNRLENRSTEMRYGSVHQWGKRVFRLPPETLSNIIRGFAHGQQFAVDPRMNLIPHREFGAHVCRSVSAHLIRHKNTGAFCKRFLPYRPHPMGKQSDCPSGKPIDSLPHNKPPA